MVQVFLGRPHRLVFPAHHQGLRRSVLLIEEARLGTSARKPIVALEVLGLIFSVSVKLGRDRVEGRVDSTSLESVFEHGNQMGEEGHTVLAVVLVNVAYFLLLRFETVLYSAVIDLRYASSEVVLCKSRVDDIDELLIYAFFHRKIHGIDFAQPDPRELDHHLLKLMRRKKQVLVHGLVVLHFLKHDQPVQVHVALLQSLVEIASFDRSVNCQVIGLPIERPENKKKLPKNIHWSPEFFVIVVKQIND